MLREKSLLWIAGLCCACFWGAGCASSVSVTDMLPDQVTSTFKEFPAEDGIAFDFTPIPAGEQFQVAVGVMDYSLNRIFEGMLDEMLRTKFTSIDKASSNRLQVRVNYINAQYENLQGTLNRVDMAVNVAVSDGGRTAEQEFTFFEEADIDGYGLQSDQIHRLLLKFTLVIDRFIDQHFEAAPPGS